MLNHAVLQTQFGASQTLEGEYKECINKTTTSSYSHILCAGFYSCISGKFISTNAFDCDGSMSCYAATTIEGIYYNSAYCMDEYSCAFVSDYCDVSFPNSAQTGEIFCHSKFGMYNSSVNSSGAKIVNAYYFGYYCGFRSRLICREDSICNINCFGNGCYGLDLVCSGDCNVICDIINSTSCPNLHAIIINNSESAIGIYNDTLLSLIDDVYKGHNITWLISKRENNIRSIIPDSYIDIYHQLYNVKHELVRNNYSIHAGLTGCFKACVNTSDCVDEWIEFEVNTNKSNNNNNNSNLCCLGYESCRNNRIHITYNNVYINNSKTKIGII